MNDFISSKDLYAKLSLEGSYYDVSIDGEIKSLCVDDEQESCVIEFTYDKENKKYTHNIWDNMFFIEQFKNSKIQIIGETK